MYCKLMVFALLLTVTVIRGLVFRPKPPKNSDLVWYVAGDVNSYTYWVNETPRFVDSLNDVPSVNQVECSFENPPPEGKACKFNKNIFFPCVEEHSFGYKSSAPCIFFKLDEIFNWVPEIYNDATKLPDAMPKELKYYIKNMSYLRPNNTNNVWFSCEGENPADVENIKSRDYFPRMGFPYYYFPFKNIRGYIPPIVAVKFYVETGVLINIECKAWAGNIHHDRSDRIGSVHFELLVD